MQAAMVLAVFEIFDQEIVKRQEVAARYTVLLEDADITDMILPHIAEGVTSVYAQYTISIPDRDALNALLKNNGIPSVPYYAVPLHLQPVFKNLGHLSGEFPVTEKVANEGLSLPMSSSLDSGDQLRITKSIKFA